MVEATREKEKMNATEKTKKRKWLGYLMHFLMYGGWIVLLVIIVGAWIGISMLTQGS